MYLIRNKYFIVAYLSVIITLGSSQNNESQIDSLRNLLPQTEGASRFNVLLDLFRLSLPNDMESAKGYAIEANQVALYNRDTLAIVKSFNALGYVTKELGFPRLSIPYFEEALKLARLKEYQVQIKYLLNNLGMANERSANYAKALEYYLESLKLREAAQDTTAITIALNNIGVLYQDMGDYENALSYYQRKYDLHVKSKNLYDFEICLINLADVCNSLKRFDSAKKYLNEAFEFCSTNSRECTKSDLALAHNTLGNTYLLKSEFNEAEKQFQTSVDLYTELKLPDRADSYHALALVRYKMGDWQGSLERLIVAQKLAEELEIPTYRLKNYQLFADIYTQKKDFQRAAEYQKMYIKLNDEIYNADLIKNISLVQSEHQEAENLRAIAARDEEIVSRDALLAARRKETLFLWITVALSAAVLFLLVRNWYSNRKDKLMLEKTVQDRTHQLFSSNEAYKKLTSELDHFIYKTSHDIQGPLRSLKGLISLAQIENSRENVFGYLQKLDFTADRLNQILKRLQTVNDINTTKLTAEPIDFSHIVDDILIMEKKKGVPPRMQFLVNIDDKALLKTNSFLLGIVLENLIDNAIKYYNDSDRITPFVKIAVAKTDNEISIKVIDNGIGFSNVPKEDVFKMFLRASERSQTGGIGLYLAKLCTEKLGGTIEMDITGEHFTQFSILLPPDFQTILDQRAANEREMDAERIRFQKKVTA